MLTKILAQKRFLKILTVWIISSFVGTFQIVPRSYAQNAALLPPVNSMITHSPAYHPTNLIGLTLHPDNPMKINFVIDPGEEQLEGERFTKEAEKLIHYFLTTLTVPEDELWVNLSPYEKERIIADGLGSTEMGRDMLAQDYILKQLTASLMYPESELGAEFWKRVYQKTQQQYGTTEITINTFNKIWIVPQKASVYTHDNHVFVTENYLKVMLEEDYLALEKHAAEKPGDEEMDPAAKEIVREILIPEIEYEVNHGKHFAPLRQIFNAMILATWYKKNLRKSILGDVYMDQNKVKGIDYSDRQVTEEIYNQYITAFREGVFNYIKEEVDPGTQEVIPRKYFSGGVRGVDQTLVTEQLTPPELPEKAASVQVDFAILPSRSGVFDQDPFKTPRVEEDNGSLWFDQQWLVGYVWKMMNRSALEGETVRPNYRQWLGDSSLVRNVLNDLAEEFKPYNLGLHSKRQSAREEQALVEITSNGLDAVDRWISRFGIGFYQALGELTEPGHRVTFAGETNEGGRIGLVFRLNKAGYLQVRPLTKDEIDGVLGDTRQTTVVRVSKPLSPEQQTAYIKYLSERVQGNQRMAMILNGQENLNALGGLSSLRNRSSELGYYDTEHQISVEVNDQGYSLSNPGTIEPRMLFEKLIIPRQGEQSGLARLKTEGQTVAADVLYSKKVGTSATAKSLVSIQVAEMAAEVIELSGIGLPERLVIKLPPNATLNAARDQVMMDDVFLKAMFDVIDLLEQVEDVQSLAALANGLMAYLQSRQASDQRYVDRLTERMQVKLRAVFRARIEKQPKLAVLPALQPFLNMELGVDYNDRIYVHQDLVDFDLRGVPGVLPVDNFRRNGNQPLLAVSYMPGTQNPPILRVGKMILLDKSIYDWANGDSRRQALVNLWLTYQIGYGTPRDELGWWGQTPEAPVVSSGKIFSALSPEVRTFSERINQGRVPLPDFFALADQIPKNLSSPEEQAWVSWIWEQLNPSDPKKTPASVSDVSQALARWQEWGGVFGIDQNQTTQMAGILTSEVYPSAVRDVFYLSDGRRRFFQSDQYSILWTETAKGSNVWVRELFLGKHDNDDVSANILPDGRTIFTLGRDGSYWIERLPGDQEEGIELTAKEKQEAQLFDLKRFKPVRRTFDRSPWVGLMLSPRYSTDRLSGSHALEEENFLVDDQGRLYLVADGTVLREQKRGSGVFDYISIDYKALDGELHGGGNRIDRLQFLPDGRLQFMTDRTIFRQNFPDDTVFHPVYRADFAGGEGAQSAVEFGMVDFLELLKDGRVFFQGKQGEMTFQLETSPGSNTFQTLTISPEDAAKFQSEIIMEILVANGRFYMQFEGGIVFTQDVNDPGRLVPLLQRSVEGQTEFITTFRRGSRIQIDHTGRIVMMAEKTLDFYTHVSTLLRETEPGSNILQEIVIPPVERQAREFMLATEDFLDLKMLNDGRIMLENRLMESAPGSNIFSVMKGPVEIVNGAVGTKVPFFEHTLLDTGGRLLPPNLTTDERDRITTFLAENGAVLTDDHNDVFYNLIRNITHLGSLAVDRIALAPFMSAQTLSRLSDEMARQWTDALSGLSYESRRDFSELINSFSYTVTDTEKFNRYLEKWLSILNMDQDLALEFFLDVNEQYFPFIVNPTSDLSDVPVQWQALLNYVRNIDGDVIPNERPQSEPDVFGGRQNLVDMLPSQLSLATLLTIQNARAAALSGEKITLTELLDVIEAEITGKQPDNSVQRETILRTVRSQSDGYAVWLRELVQNARDELRRMGLTDENIRIAAWFDGEDRIVRVSDPIGMSLFKLLNIYLPIDVSDKYAGLTGKIGQGNYSIWLDASRVRLRTGDGTGRSYAVELRAVRDAQGTLEDVVIEHFEEFNDGFKGTVIEHEKSFAGNIAAGYLESAVLQRNMSRFLGDMQDTNITLTTFETIPIHDQVTTLSSVQDKTLEGAFEVLWTTGASRVTADGLEVHALTKEDTAGVAPVIASQLTRANLLLRWPKATPLTETRNDAALREMDQGRWNKLRKASLLLAAVEALQQYGVWIPDLPQDLFRGGYSLEENLVEDARKLRAGDFESIDFTPYEDGEEAINLIASLKGASGLSIVDVKAKLYEMAREEVKNEGSQREALERLKAQLPGLASKIDHSFNLIVFSLQDKKKREELTEEQLSLESRNLGEAGYPYLHRLFEGLAGTAVVRGETQRTSLMTLNENVAGFVSGLQPDVIRVSKSFADRMEPVLAAFMSREGELTEEEVRHILTVLELYVHEYAHTEEFGETGRSSHLTHQKEGVLENSFPKRMERIIERLLVARWDAGQAAPVTSDAAVLSSGNVTPVDENKSRVGGIDLNPANLDLEEQGTTPAFKFTAEEMQGVPVPAIEGIRPVIINVTPISNLPLFLGLKEEDDYEKLTHLPR